MHELLHLSCIEPFNQSNNQITNYIFSEVYCDVCKWLALSFRKSFDSPSCNLFGIGRGVYPSLNCFFYFSCSVGSLFWSLCKRMHCCHQPRRSSPCHRGCLTWLLGSYPATEPIRRPFRRLLELSWRDTTKSTYESLFKCWDSWCQEQTPA